MTTKNEKSQRDTAELKKPCVVLDTNVWRSELLLRNPLGAALIFAVRSSGGRIGLPEVISDEIFKQLKKAGEEAVAFVRRGFSALEKLVGSRSTYELPSTEQIDQCIRERFQEINSFLQSIPFTPEHARSALNRVNDETPPNGPKNQQFKDSAIWEAILELAKTYRVYFVTSDKSFFQDHDPQKGLATFLRSEVLEKGVAVSVYYRDLSLCLAALRHEVPPIDEEKLGEAIDTAVRAVVTDSARTRSFLLLKHAGTKVEAFLTERPSTLSLAFELTYSLQDSPESEGLDRTEATAVAKGDCSYLLDSGEMTDFRVAQMKFSWRDENMRQQQQSNVYMSMGNTIGGRATVKYGFREPLSRRFNKGADQ